MFWQKHGYDLSFLSFSLLWMCLNEWMNYAFILRFIVYCCTPKVLYNHGGGGSLLNYHQCAASTWMRSLMAWRKKLLLSLSVYAIMLQKRLPDGSKMKRRLPGWFESLMILAALLLQRLRQMPCRNGRANPEMRSAKRTTHCRALQSWLETFPYHTEVLEAAHPLHRGPTDHKRSVGPLLSLSEVHNHFFSFAHIQRETVVLAPWCKSLYLIQVCDLIIVVNEAQNHSIISKFDNRSGAVRGHAVVCVERVEQGTQDTTLWGSYVQGNGVGGETYFLPTF